MEDPNRKMISFRLTEEARKALAFIARYRGISQAAVLEQLIRDEAQRVNIEHTVKPAA
jgi:hypothetical protein